MTELEKQATEPPHLAEEAETEFVAAWESSNESIQWTKGTLNGGETEYVEQAKEVFAGSEAPF